MVQHLFCRNCSSSLSSHRSCRRSQQVYFSSRSRSSYPFVGFSCIVLLSIPLFLYGFAASFMNGKSLFPTVFNASAHAYHVNFHDALASCGGSRGRHSMLRQRHHYVFACWNLPLFPCPSLRSRLFKFVALYTLLPISTAKFYHSIHQPHITHHRPVNIRNRSIFACTRLILPIRIVLSSFTRPPTPPMFANLPRKSSLSSPSVPYLPSSTLCCFDLSVSVLRSTSQRISLTFRLYSVCLCLFLSSVARRSIVLVSCRISSIDIVLFLL